MLSAFDLLKVSYAVETDDDKNIKFIVFNWFTIKQAFTKDLYFVPSNSTIKEVGTLLVDKEFRALPVLDVGELLAIVTSRDFIRF